MAFAAMSEKPPGSPEECAWQMRASTLNTDKKRRHGAAATQGSDLSGREQKRQGRGRNTSHHFVWDFSGIFAKRARDFSEGGARLFFRTHHLRTGAEFCRASRRKVNYCGATERTAG